MTDLHELRKCNPYGRVHVDVVSVADDVIIHGVGKYARSAIPESRRTPCSPDLEPLADKVREAALLMLCACPQA